jgi:hypothetical protein
VTRSDSLRAASSPSERIPYDAKDTQLASATKDQQDAYEKAGYTHYDCSCDTDQDKAAWASLSNGEVHNDLAGDALVFGAVLAGVEGLFYPRVQTEQPRLPQDENRQNNYPQPPDPNNGKSTIGPNPNQAAALNRDIQQAKADGATDIRVNQEQVNAQGVRVGQNRPDLQYTDRNGTRHYVEYDTDPSNGIAHAQRLRANDPTGVVTTRTIK